MEIRVSSLAIKWPGCEADQSHQSSADIKHEWSDTSTTPPPPVCLHCMYGDSCTFVFLRLVGTELVVYSDEPMANSCHLINESVNRLGLLI